MSTDNTKLPSPNTFAVIALIVCALRCAVALAGPETLPTRQLGEMTSNQGESLPAFLARVGERLRAFSDRTGFEGCGELATDGTRYGVELGSNGSHIGCVIHTERVPASMHATGESIHSHGQDKRFCLNAADVEMFEPGAAMPVKPVCFMGQHLAEFSEQDYRSGPGYLATPSGILHQHGAGTVQLVIAYGGVP